MSQYILFFFLFVLTNTGQANNIQISNLIYIPGTLPNTSKIQFNISWENSWRISTGPANFDGAYVFFKVKGATGNWIPVTFNGIGNVTPTGFEATQFGHQHIGTILHRSVLNTGQGNVSLVNIQLGVSDLPVFNAEIRGFAIEMVNVPETATFCMGDSINSDGSDLTLFVTTSIPGINYASIDSTQWTLLRTLPNSPIDGYSMKLDGLYIKANDSIGWWAANPFPPFSTFIAYNGKYPTGGEMWCMKYEITQGAYRDFLNTLTYVQQQARTTNDPSLSAGTSALVPSGSSYRNEIRIKTPSISGQPAMYGCDYNNNGIYDEGNDGEYIACNWLNRDDINAWLWWAGMNIITEPQYERIARGNIGSTPILPVYNDYAWGDNNFVTTSYIMANLGAPNESIMNLNMGSANAIVGSASLGFGGSGGPARNGICATSSSTRLTSGSNIFGIMDLTGNVFEACLQIGDALNTDFYDNRTYGSLNHVSNGYLNTNGKSPVNPELILRGGCFYSGSERASVSVRADGPLSGTLRSPGAGARGVISLVMVN